MKLTQKTIDVIQWLLIIGLFVMLAIQGIAYKNNRKKLQQSIEYNKENTYVRIYESQSLDKLKKENRELYDSISKLKDVESGMIIRYRERYLRDTIWADKFITRVDTIYHNNDIARIDSVYHYTEDNDTVKCNIEIGAADLKWCRADIIIDNKFTIINREKNGTNQTFITHGENTEILDTQMWHRKDKIKWYQKFKVGPNVGVGRGLVNGNWDVYVGFGINYGF